MNIFEKLRSGEPVDMMSEEYRPAVQELHRADKALFHLNHAEPQSEEWSRAFSELFDGEVPEGLGVFTPTQIDFPRQITFGKHVFINHNFTAMSIASFRILTIRGTATSEGQQSSFFAARKRTSACIFSTLIRACGICFLSNRS